jgi:hypothetical protein
MGDAGVAATGTWYRELEWAGRVDASAYLSMTGGAGARGGYPALRPAVVGRAVSTPTGLTVGVLQQNGTATNRVGLYAIAIRWQARPQRHRRRSST